ncbi:transporter [Clostridium thermosuccinogenes]|jgi:uncharacterized membrane protein|uniref:Transporter n=1 Tax=Clostridium thermosuccinogenes TaxID=84032 RepID=A0A2K2F6G8_9CLOT|nr:transporter [Pseudoclostridium thermosuccinogenes]PNT94354.1 transporter [Pseudoclostridium thermosuccinogenes]PNT99723.1 transporter [Pseudoclostridium thermosuccinogenes]PNU01284.1 transporter [Pseudoclostridium thermosuccinogenes]
MHFLCLRTCHRLTKIKKWGNARLKKTRFITEAAVIAAMYAALTIIFAPISFGQNGQIQIRVSEALTILPMFTPAAIPGLFVGCLIANIYGGLGPIDMIFGSAATLIAAFMTYKMPKKYLVPLPPVIVNGVIIGMELTYLYQVPLLISMATVAFGELVACYGLGYPLILLLEKSRKAIFAK